MIRYFGAAAVIQNIGIPGNVINEAGGAQGLPTFAIGTEDANALKGLMSNDGPSTPTETRRPSTIFQS